MEADDKPWLFKPGQSGNPSGRPPISPAERMMRENFTESFAMLGTKTIEEIKALAQDPKQPAPVAIAAKALEWAFKKGNPGMYQQIWDRTMGKVRQDVELSGGLSVRPYQELETDELRNRIAALEGRASLPAGESESEDE